MKKNEHALKEQPEWYDSLSQPPFDRPQWKAQSKEKLMSELHGRRSRGIRPRRQPLRTASVVFALAFLLLGAAWLSLQGSSDTPANGTKPLPALQWDLYPGGDLTAGEPAGAMWMLHQSIDSLLGHTIRITAAHQQSGLVLEELPAMMITKDTAQDYPAVISSQSDAVDSTRITSTMALPIGGQWRFELFMDGLPSGERTLNVPDSGWELSPSFVSGAYEMTGTAGKLGFIDAGFVAEATNKYMWHLWGTDEELTGRLEVYGIMEGSSELIPVFNSMLVPNPLNGADASVHSMMMLPSPGKWKLIATMNGRWFGSIVVEANQPPSP